MSTSLLSFESVSIQFGGLKALDEVSFSIQEGEVFGIIGPNGAGKTTLFNVLTGIYRPTSGKIRFRGVEVPYGEPESMAHLGIARTFQNLRLFKELSALDNVLIALDASPDFPRPSRLSTVLRTNDYQDRETNKRERAMELLREIGIERFAGQKTRQLPYGVQKRLELARALALHPKLILLDEPAAGLNAQETHDLLGLLGTLREKHGITFCLIEHDMKLVMNLCSPILVLNFGKRLACGTPSEVQNDEEVKNAYLGSRSHGK